MNKLICAKFGADLIKILKL